MTVEHAVGESVVVPGLKLTDHTFQVLHRITGFFRFAVRDTVAGLNAACCKPCCSTSRQECLS